MPVTNFMDYQKDINPSMREILNDWLIEVHQQFSLIQETLYLTVAVLDRFLQEEGATISTKQLQLVGVTSMLIAAKYEEMYPPEVDDFVYITDKAYKQSEILQMEMRILKTLDFDLGRPLPINFLRSVYEMAFMPHSPRLEYVCFLRVCISRMTKVSRIYCK